MYKDNGELNKVQEATENNQTAVDHTFDVIVVGAGLSGIGAARQIVEKCPKLKFCILERRQSLGGTWDLFQYPGIRSDSDMYTMGYDSKPWREPEAIANGPSILRYINEAAIEKGIDQTILFNHKVTSASWSSNEHQWKLTVETNLANSKSLFACNFLYVCSGYYDYDSGYRPRFENEGNFRGQIVHPQFWPEGLNFKDKKVTVIGSGATAMTLVPSMAKTAKKVVMLQRSPTYVVSLPSVDPIVKITNLLMPLKLAYAFNRWRYITLQRYIYRQTRVNPMKVKNKLLSLVHKNLGNHCNVEKHFTPTYNPWDQRLCLIPDGDLYKAIKRDKAEIVTDKIKSFSKIGIVLESGEEIETDIIVTATGLNLKLLGGISFEIDDKKVVFSEKYTYKGLMFSNVPNLVYSIGYINASWTLRSEITAEFVCRILNRMKEADATEVVAHKKNEGISTTDSPLIDDFSPGYIRRGAHLMAKQSDKDPWKFNQNYTLDKKLIRNAPLEDGVLEFR